MAGLVKVPINNQGGFAGLSVPSFGGVYERGPYSRAQQSIYTHRIDNKTVAKSDGTRALVNEGTAGGDYVLQSGQGLKGDGTQYIDTGVIPDLSKDLTVLWCQQRSGVTTQQNGSISNAVNGMFNFGFDASGMAVGIGDASASVADTLIDLKVYRLQLKYKASTGVAEIKNLDTGASGEITVTDYAGIVDSILLFDVNKAAAAVNAIQKDFFYIPHYFTDAESIMHQQHPEDTVYLKNGVVMSGFLSQAVLDEMSAGNGFAYPLCENNGAGNLAYNISCGRVSPMVVSYASDWTLISDSDYTIESSDVAENRGLFLDLQQGVRYILEIDITLSQGSVRYRSGEGTFKVLPAGYSMIEITVNASTAELYGLSAVGTVSIKSITAGAEIVNAANAEMRLTADYLDIGIQTALLEQDAKGLITGLAKDDSLEGSGSGGIDLVGQTFDGAFYLDLYLDITDAKSSLERVLEGDAFDEFGAVLGLFDFRVGLAPLQIRLKLGNVFRSLNLVKGVVTLSVNNAGIATVSNNNGYINTFFSGVFKVVITDLLRNANALAAVQIGTGTRTAEEEAVAVSRMKSKYGVV